MANAVTEPTRPDAVLNGQAPRASSRPFDLPLPMKVGWGLGTLSVAIGLTAQNMLVLRFMTDFVGIGAATAGLLIAASKIYDAVTDPVMGVISDRTPARFGRRRPYLLVGGVLLAASMLAVFNVPGGLEVSGRVIYMTAVLLLFATAYTMFNVPYLAMPAEMTHSYHQRSDLMTYRIYAVALSGLLASFAGPIIISEFGGEEAGHRAMSYFLAPVILAAAVVCFRATRNAPFTTRQKERSVAFVEQVRLAAGNRPFILLLAIKFCTLLNLGVTSIMPFFFTYILEISYAYLGTFALFSQLSLMFSQRLWLRVSRKVGKRNTYMIALAVAMITPLSWLAAGPGEPLVLLFARAIVAGCAAGGVLLMGQALLPDTIEYDYLRTGLRREGVFAGLYTTVEKLATALGVAMIGAFLGAMGYVQSTGAVEVEQPASAITAIYICISAVPVTVEVICLGLLTRYRLSKERLDELKARAQAAR